MEPAKNFIQDKLPNTHRRNKRKTDTSGADKRADILCLGKRSRLIECSSIRQNRCSMAKRKSPIRRKHKRQCNLGATCSFIQHGKHKCTFNSPKHAPARKNKAIKQRSYFANEIFIRQPKHKAAKKC